MNYLRQELGAVPQLAVMSDLSALARTLVAKETAPFVLVTLGKNGASPVVAPFQTREEIDQTTDSLDANRGDRSYYAAFERSSGGKYGRFTERYFEFSVTNIWSQVKPLLPFIVGGFALLAGVVYFQKKGKAPARRRGRAAYSRRTTTVWR